MSQNDKQQQQISKKLMHLRISKSGQSSSAGSCSTGNSSTSSPVSSGPVTPKNVEQLNLPPPNLPDLRIFVGTFIQSKSLSELQIWDNTIIGVENGIIVFIEPIELLSRVLEERKIEEMFLEWIMLEIPKGGFLMPGFVDLHAQAFPFIAAGTTSAICPGYKNDAAENRYKSLTSLVVHEHLAKDVYKRMLRRSLFNGTTCVAYDTGATECEGRQLARILANNLQRAFLGLEVHLDDKKDDVHLMHLPKVEDFYAYLNRLGCANIHPYMLASNPFPHWICDRVKQIRDHHGGLIVKMNGKKLSTEKEQYKLGLWVDIGKSSLSYSNGAGLINNKTLLTHGNYLSPEEIEMIGQTGSTVVHCPLTDLKDPLHICPVRSLIKVGVNVALGTDCAESSCVSMLEAIRAAVRCSHIRRSVAHYTQHIHNLYKNSREHLIQKLNLIQDPEVKKEGECLLDHFWTDDHLEPITHVNAFYMATLGGAKALGLDDKIGRFDIGKQFDAIMVQTDLKDGPFDVYNPEENKKDLLEKFLELGDDRNIAQVYVAGKQAK